MTRREARCLGLTRYDTGMPCRHGHLGERYSESGQCCECWRLKNQRRRGRLRKRPEYVPRPWKVLSHPRVLAKAAGELTYQGKPCKRGHGTERYVSSSECRECARLSSVASHKAQLRGGRRRSEMNRQVDEVQRAKRREKARKYRARQRAAGKDYSTEDVRWLMTRQGGKCGICLLKLGKSAWEVDHRVSLVDGGTNERANLHITCMPCNRSKGKRHEIDHAREHFGRLL